MPKWAVAGTSTTTAKISELCAKHAVEAQAYPYVVARVNPKIREELAKLGRPESCVFTSSRAVELVYHNSDSELREAIARSKVYSIGPATAKRVRELFGVDSAVPTVYDSRGLSKLLEGARLGRTTLFSSTERSELLVDVLERCSSTLFEPKLYSLDVDQIIADRFLTSLSSGEFRGVVFTCSTAVRPIQGMSPMTNLVFVAMGRRTFETLRLAGHSALIPANSTVEDVVRLIVELGS